jgi:hypothetical protein
MGTVDFETAHDNNVPGILLGLTENLQRAFARRTGVQFLDCGILLRDT